MTKKPDSITNYDLFLKNTTLKDRDALLYGLYHITYEEIRNYDVFCGTCRKQYPVTVQASSTFNINSYPGKDILKKEVYLVLPSSEKVTVFFKQPTLFDEMMHFKTGGISPENMDLLMETLIITKFQYQPDEEDTVIYSDREDIVDAYKSLPAKDKRAIYKKFREEFGQYGIKLRMRSTCIHCSSIEEIDIDLVDNFFRMVHSI
jgi:hypothetical protein